MKLSRASIGLAVRSARELARLTATDLCLITGMDRSALSRTENGLRSLEFSEALAIAEAVGIDVESLRTLAETFEREGAQELVSGRRELKEDLNRLQRDAIAAAIELGR